jgi:photosystem II stability/assembly factor-like uncharacterized protein
VKYVFAYLTLLLPAAFAQRWTVQYFYDQDRTSLLLDDLAFPSAQRGIAAGSIYEESAAGRKPKFTVLVSADGGEHWSLKPVSEHPRSLFFLDDKTGWMVTDEGIWFTADSGENWKKISDQKKPDRKLQPAPQGGLILRVWFLDPQHGFAVGLQKTVLETHDGGRNWTPVPEAAKVSANPSFTAYTRIAFDGPMSGFITGGSTPPRPDDANQLPPWLEPERAVKRKQIPNLTLLLQTTDGGATWHTSTSPLFGVVTSVRLARPDGLIVMGFNESFEWPSEVHHFDLSTGKTTLVFREKNLRVVDGVLFAGPRGFLGAVEPTGQLNSAPIPGKVRILTSTNLTDWSQMDVDYRAVARSVILAGPDAGHLWAATDTGMILHLLPGN